MTGARAEAVASRWRWCRPAAPAPGTGSHLGCWYLACRRWSGATSSRGACKTANSAGSPSTPRWDVRRWIAIGI